MGKYKRNTKRPRGFTLIELVLVLGLVVALGALAAPQFADVFDHSKDNADIAQMDQILTAFQLQQTSFYENHDGDYDLLKDENVSYVRKDGKIIDTIVDPEQAEKTFQVFLDNVVKPGSDVYMEGAKCVKTGKTHVAKSGKQISVFEAKLNSTKTGLKIVCRADKNESSIELSLPGLNKPIDDVYSDGEPLKGTWMIIGDDDRLRADYVKDLLYHVREKDENEENDEAYKAFKNKVKQDHEYRYRTTFKIDANLKKEEPIVIDKAWITFDSQYAGNHNFFIFNNVTEDDVDAYLTVFEYKDGKLKKTYEIGQLPKGAEMYKSPPGHSGTPGNDKHEVRYVFSFMKNGNYVGKIAHKIHFIHKNNVTSEMLTFISNDGNGVDEGYYDTGSNSFRYFHHLYDPAMSDLEPGTSGLPGSQTEENFTFHTGAVFNINNLNNGSYNNYDFLSFEENSDGEMALRSYRVRGGSVSEFESEAILNGFEFGKTYTMELTVKKGKTTVALSNNLLGESNKVFITSQDLHPAIGYYMNQEVVLGNDPAIAGDNDDFPFVSYESDAHNGPKFILLNMPEVYPYQPKNIGGDDPDDPDEPVASKPGLVEFKYDCGNGRIELDSKNDNSMEYKWVYNLDYEGDDPNQSNDIKIAGECDDKGDVICVISGWLYARDMIDGKGIGQWYKSPWVNIDDYTIEMVSTEVPSKPDKQKISYNPEGLPNDFNWYIKGSGTEKERTSIRIKNVSQMNEIDVWAYVKWNDKQISSSKGKAFGYCNFGAGVVPNIFEVKGILSAANGNRYNLQLLSDDQYKLTVVAYHYKNKGGLVNDFTQTEITVNGNLEQLSIGKGFTNLKIDIEDMDGHLYQKILTYPFTLGEFPIPLR